MFIPYRSWKSDHKNNTHVKKMSVNLVFRLFPAVKRVNNNHVHVLDQTVFCSKTGLEGSKTNCRVSVTSRKSVGRPWAHFRGDKSTTAGSDGGGVSLQATGRCNKGYQVLCRTAVAEQKSMSLEDNQNIYQSISCKLEFGRRVRGGAVGGGGGELELHDGAHDMVGDTSNGEIQDSAVQLVMDRVVSIWVGIDKGLPFISDLSAPWEHARKLWGQTGKNLYFFINLCSI